MQPTAALYTHAAIKNHFHHGNNQLISIGCSSYRSFYRHVGALPLLARTEVLAAVQFDGRTTTCRAPYVLTLTINGTHSGRKQWQFQGVAINTMLSTYH